MFTKKEMIENLVFEVRESLKEKGVYDVYRTAEVIEKLVLCDEKYAELYSYLVDTFAEIERTRLTYVKDQLTENLYYRMHSVVVQCVNDWKYGDFKAMVRSQLNRTVNGRIVDSVKRGFEATSYEQVKEFTQKDALKEEAVEVNYDEKFEIEALVEKYVEMLPAARLTKKLRPRSEYVVRQFLSGENSVKEIAKELAVEFDIPFETARTFTQKTKNLLKAAIGGVA